jgi:hypothetical protein
MYVAFVFGEHQRSYEIQFLTEQGRDICVALREPATEMAIYLQQLKYERMETPTLRMKLREAKGYLMGWRPRKC